jgi:dTDP-4-amino-4,6-dideoxygalactose transaminase
MSQPQKGVPLLDLKRLDETLASQLRAAFERVLSSGHFILGPETQALEKELAAYCGAKHAIGVSSGTDALLLALMALDVGPGDEVICPTYTFFATAGAIWRLGAKPVFVDCSPESYNVEARHVERALTAKTKAVIPVHLFGQCAELDPILAVCKKHGVAVVEDAAQAIGSEYKGRRAGAFGEFGCFSFFPSKNLGALGDGGFVTANDDALAEKARILRTHGSKPKYYHKMVGGNFRLDELQAALLRVKLPRLDDWTAVRQRNAALYRQAFQAAGLVGKNISLPTEQPERRHIYNQFVIRVPGAGKRDELKNFLTSRKIGCEIYYPVPMHLQECFSSLGVRAGALPAAESAAQETLAVPIFPELREDELHAVVSACAEFFKTNP